MKPEKKDRTLNMLSRKRTVRKKAMKELVKSVLAVEKKTMLKAS